jgi:hypothetical protein
MNKSVNKYTIIKQQNSNFHSFIQNLWRMADLFSSNPRLENCPRRSPCFCLAFSVTRPILEPRNRRLFPRMGFRPSGRPFRGVQKASFLGSGLVRIPSAFRPQNTGKRDSSPARRSHRFRRTKRGNEPISGLSGKRFPILPSRSKKT